MTPDPEFAELIAGRPHLSRDASAGLICEGVPLNRIADDVGTPAFVYAAGALRMRYRRLAEAMRESGLDPHIHYAVKANDHLAVISVLAREGAGADIVSGGELRRARHAGIAAADIVFSGVGKTDAEISLAVGEQIAQINVESVTELRRISAIAAGMGREISVVLRVNPDIDARTHDKISTGKRGDKFGIAHDEIIAAYRYAAALPGLKPIGLAAHIGSQIFAMDAYRATFERLSTLIAGLRAEGETPGVIDCGGGLGIQYRDETPAHPRALASAIKRGLGHLGVRIIIEPGRWLVGPAGLLLASVIQEKTTGNRRFVVLDAAMNDLVRPAMYGAWHAIVPVGAAGLVAPVSAADIVGPVCESSDFFARDRAMPVLGENARVAILDAGAYAAVMSSTYNARPLAAQVMVDGDEVAVITPRQAVEQLWANETVPSWLTKPGLSKPGLTKPGLTKRGL
jgi:diaminopimelate decarboxylase